LQVSDDESDSRVDILLKTINEMRVESEDSLSESESEHFHTLNDPTQQSIPFSSSHSHQPNVLEGTIITEANNNSLLRPRSMLSHIKQTLNTIKECVFSV
jgi:hypothetical protein